MQDLYWKDKNELDIIDRKDLTELQEAKNFYKVGNTVCVNSSLGSFWGKILKIDNDNNTLDIWVKPGLTDYGLSVMFLGKTIIHNVPISALY